MPPGLTKSIAGYKKVALALPRNSKLVMGSYCVGLSMGLDYSRQDEQKNWDCYADVAQTVDLLKGRKENPAVNIF